MDYTSMLQTSLLTSNGTNTSLPAWSGFAFLFGSAFFWGSNYLPVKQYETGMLVLNFFHNIKIICIIFLSPRRWNVFSIDSMYWHLDCWLDCSLGSWFSKILPFTHVGRFNLVNRKYMRGPDNKVKYWRIKKLWYNGIFIN